MDGDKELIDKLQHVWHSARPFPQEPWDRIIALVRENDGRRWLQAIRKSMLENHFGTKCTLDTIADVRKRLDAIPQSAEPPSPAAEPRRDPCAGDYLTWGSDGHVKYVTSTLIRGRRVALYGIEACAVSNNGTVEIDPVIPALSPLLERMKQNPSVDAFRWTKDDGWRAIGAELQKGGAQ